MSNDLHSSVAIDHKQSQAICTEIGRRLRSELGESPSMPPHLSKLMDRLMELDREDASSVARLLR